MDSTLFKKEDWNKLLRLGSIASLIIVCMIPIQMVIFGAWPPPDNVSDFFVLFQKTWIYHWDVVGPDFHQLHTLFGEQYNTMFEEIDTLTEHMRYLTMKPVSTLTRITEVSQIDQASNSAQEIDANEMIRQLRDDNKKIIEIFSEVSEEADRQKQFATSNLVQTIIETHGKFHWMLRSFLE